MKDREPLISFDKESFEISEDQSIGCCDAKEVRELEEHATELNRKVNIALSAFQKILDSDMQPYDFICKTMEKMGEKL